MKVAIIGYSGCGKSTLASTIARENNVPLLHLDKVHWIPGWIERPEEQEKKIIKEFMDKNDSWVIDGNYQSLEYSRRMEEADRIIFLAFPRLICLARAWRRARKYRGKTRSSMAEGCPEKLDAEFVLWILHEGRTRKIQENYKRIMLKYGDKAVKIHNQKELDEERRKWMKH